MNTTDDLERHLRSMLADSAPRREPEALFASVMASTRTVRQRPGLWVGFRSGDVGSAPRTAVRLAPALLVGLLVAALLGALALVGGRLDSPPVVPLPATSGFVATGSMGVARGSATAIELLDGRVLVVGGTDSDHRILRSAEIYNPVTGTFSPTGDMAYGRAGYTKMRHLSDGRIMVHGGCCNGGPGVASEIYDPATGTFSPASDPETSPELMQVGGRVLQVVPASGESGSVRPFQASRATWLIGSEPLTEEYAAVHLADGRWLALEVLQGANGPTMGAAFMYDPETGVFTRVGDQAARHPYPVAQLADGRILLVGDSVGNAIPPGAELFDPSTGTFETVEAPGSEGPVVAAARLPDGQVLLTFDPGPRIPELFDPATGAFTVLDSPLEDRSYPTTVVLHDGRILFLGGYSTDEGPSLASAELYGSAQFEGQP